MILLDWRQYGVDGWIQFALAVDPLILLVARSGSEALELLKRQFYTQLEEVG